MAAKINLQKLLILAAIESNLRNIEFTCVNSMLDADLSSKIDFTSM
jgi:hypothetical protein